MKPEIHRYIEHFQTHHPGGNVKENTPGFYGIVLSISKKSMFLMMQPCEDCTKQKAAPLRPLAALNTAIDSMDLSNTMAPCIQREVIRFFVEAGEPVQKTHTYDAESAQGQWLQATITLILE